MRVENNNKNHTGLLITSGLIGAGTGAVYARNHISDEIVKKIEGVNINTPKYFTDIADCVDITKAESAAKSGSIAHDELNVLKNLKDKYINYAKDENKIKEIIDTPLNERKISFKDAVSTANNSRWEAWKASISNKMVKKYSDIGIINGGKWADVVKNQKVKAKEALKIMAKPISKGLAAGAALGVLIGLGIRSIIKD